MSLFFSLQVRGFSGGQGKMEGKVFNVSGLT